MRNSLCFVNDKQKKHVVRSKADYLKSQLKVILFSQPVERTSLTLFPETQYRR